jgi:hypothetical protein
MNEMNERIFELAKQADEGYTGIYDDDMGHALVGREAIQKFAKSIIKECRNAISELDVDSPEATIALLMADGAIRSRFGVDK